MSVCIELVRRLNWAMNNTHCGHCVSRIQVLIVCSLLSANFNHECLRSVDPTLNRAQIQGIFIHVQELHLQSFFFNF